MARLTSGLDPQKLDETIALVNEEKTKLGYFQENWGLYVPLLMGVVTMANLITMRSKNEKLRKLYDQYYPLINGLTMMIPAYFSWKTIKLRKIEREIAQQQGGVLGGLGTLFSSLNNPWYDDDIFVSKHIREDSQSKLPDVWTYKKKAGALPLSNLEKEEYKKQIKEMKEKVDAIITTAYNKKRDLLRRADDMMVSVEAGVDVERLNRSTKEGRDAEHWYRLNIDKSMKRFKK